MEALRLNRENFKEVLGRTVEAVKGGQILVCPTDTVYGLICDATDKEAVKKLFEIKKRPKGKPVSIFVKDLKMAKKFARIDKRQEEFLNKVWPGAVTAVLRPKKILPEEISAGKNTIGVRVPKYKLILNLISKVDQPLAESSANISGQPPSTKIKEVLKQFEKKKRRPDLVIDAGNLKKARPSAVIDLTGRKPKIIRTSPSARTLIRYCKNI